MVAKWCSLGICAGRQVLPQEPQGLAHDIARRSAVVEEVKGVGPFSMVHEGNREILDKSLTDEPVDGGIHRRKLVASGPGDEQRHIPSKIRHRAADAWVCEAKLSRRISDVRRAVEIE